ncbi:MAG: DoxX family protein [Bacteroidia bacterium]
MEQVLLWLMCLLYVAAGVNHFINPQWYITIIPLWVPYPVTVNYISGACEILFGLLLLPVATRAVSAYLLIALLIAVFPANIQMSLNYWHSNNPNFWLTILRLPFQLLLIWWAWQYTGRK